VSQPTNAIQVSFRARKIDRANDAIAEGPGRAAVEFFSPAKNLAFSTGRV
jgi:hypothetical protein